MIPPSGAREDSGDGLTGEATGTEQPPSPASTSSLESKEHMLSTDCAAEPVR
uniref:Src homology three (SH3) and cysteine rich domain n=1 Tax=Mus musculus TaxID=10090 RepID=F2Z462_MOUSE